MKFNEKYSISPEFEDLFKFENEEQELEHDAKMIMFRFLSEIEKINNGKNIKNKDLADIFGTSKSYITQLLRGDKLINLLKIAKLQEAYDITFDIKAIYNKDDYKDIVNNYYKSEKQSKINNEVDGFWVFHSTKSVYERKQNVENSHKKNPLQVA